MNTAHLRYAVAVAETGSITQAAEQLYLTQPNLSKAIKELENGLGIVIFDRTAKGMRPTPKGAEFLSRARSILSQIDELEALGKPDDDARQAFSLSMPRGSYIANALADFAAQLDPAREWEINIDETNSMQTIQDVAEGRFRLGIVRYREEHERYFRDYMRAKGLAVTPIWDFEYLAVMSSAHPLAQAERVARADLSRCVEIIHGDTCVPYLPPQADAQKGARRIYVYERGSQFDLLMRVPRSYMWVSPIPGVYMRRYGLTQRRCADHGERCMDVLVHRASYALTPTDERFLAILFRSRDEVAGGEYR